MLLPNPYDDSGEGLPASRGQPVPAVRRYHCCAVIDDDHNRPAVWRAITRGFGRNTVSAAFGEERRLDWLQVGGVLSCDSQEPPQFLRVAGTRATGVVVEQDMDLARLPGEVAGDSGPFRQLRRRVVVVVPGSASSTAIPGFGVATVEPNVGERGVGHGWSGWDGVVGDLRLVGDGIGESRLLQEREGGRCGVLRQPAVIAKLD